MGVGQELNKVIVVGIPTNSTAEDLRLLCKPFGGIAEATVVSNAEGKGRGFGFVRFETEAAQLECVEKLNTTLIKGRTLNVRVVEKRSPSGAAPSGSGKGRPCFDFARGKCAKGAACKWAHIVPDPGASSSRKDPNQRGSNQKRDLDAPVSAALQGIPDDVCRKFQLGKCHRGAACRWKHEYVFKANQARKARPGRGSGDADGDGDGVGDDAGDGGGDGGGAEVAAAPDADVQEVVPKRLKAAAKVTSAAKRKAEAPATTEQEAAPAAAAAAAPRKPFRPIGGETLVGPSGHREVESETVALRRQLAQKEAAWREQHGGEGPVPEQAKNRDVVWRALERKLQRAQLDSELAGLT